MEGRPTKACSSAAAGRTPWASSRPSRWDTACRTRRSPTARCGSCRHSTAAADVKVRVRNTGDREGAEVVQLYVGLPASRRKVLKAFRKLDPGQRSIVTLTLDQRDLSVRDDHDHTNTWVNPGGRYRLMVGSSSRDLRSTSTFAHQGSNRATLQRSGELVADLGPRLDHHRGGDVDSRFRRPLVAAQLVMLRAELGQRALKSALAGVYGCTSKRPPRSPWRLS